MRLFSHFLRNTEGVVEGDWKKGKENAHLYKAILLEGVSISPSARLTIETFGLIHEERLLP